jgi:phenylacetate-CoA ligase
MTNWLSDMGGRLIGNAVYPLWTMRSHPAYRSYRRQFEKQQYMGRQALEQLQLRQLRDLVDYAYRYVPYYRMKMDQRGLTPLDIREISDMCQLPVLTKRAVQDHGADLLSRKVPESKRVLNRTGGSTGSPLHFWVDKERFDSRRASTDRHNAWAGLRPGDWYAHLWGALLDTGGKPGVARLGVREKLLYRSLLLNTSSITEADLQEFLSLLRKYRPRHLLAYAQSAVYFARYCRENAVRDIHFDSIITTAEVLREDQRAQLEETFSARVFNRYGCREVSVIASECEYHTGLHVNADALYVEIEQLPGLPLGHGRVLVTDMLNRSMPLIRYEIGDVAAWAEKQNCPCGRNFPLLASVEGRTTDFLYLPDGGSISGIALALVIAIPSVRQAQFVQQADGRIVLNVVAGNGFSDETPAVLRQRLAPYLHNQVPLEIKRVSGVRQEPSGKYRFVVSEYSRPLEKCS